MSSVGEVAATLQSAAQDLPIDSWQHQHQHLADHVHPVVAALASESHGPELAAAATLLATAITALAEACRLAHHVQHQANAWCTEHAPAAIRSLDPPSAVGPSPRVTHPDTPEPPLPQYNGKTIADHVANRGRSIGRRPVGRKKMTIRLVDSIGELNEIWRALSEGGQPFERGTYREIVRLRDGSTIGYRLKVKLGDVGTTLDLEDPAGNTLKIHIDKEDA